MSIITLTTDFGTKDGFVGTLKGVIWGICPQAQIADISHDIPPQDILAGAFALWRAYPFFPPGTIHVAVVDPGVGTTRRPIAARLGGHTFVGPDNGLFTPPLRDAERYSWKIEIVQLLETRYFLPDISRTFHGRDIFAPTAAHLANGVPLTEFGPAILDPVLLPLPEPERTPTGWRAHITVVDVFGNCTTDLSAADLGDHKQVSFHVKGHGIDGLVKSYGERSPGDLVALVDSEAFIEIAQVNGSASKVLDVRPGDLVEVFIHA
jgi:S-adenosyl-L-methionine hydrolase (adenosine-forming)